MIVRKIRITLNSYRFGQGRRMAKLQEGFRKDFTTTQAVQIQFLNEQKDHIKIDNVLHLSSALNQGRASKPVYIQKHFTMPSKHKLNNHLKSAYKKSIDKNIPSLLSQVKESLEDQTLKWQENRVLGQEAKKFQKVYFTKKEINRLQLNESKRPSNFLPLDQLQNKGETILADLNLKNYLFQQTIYQLQNQRLNRLTQKNQSNQDLYFNINKSEILNQDTTNQDIISIPESQQKNDELALNNFESTIFEKKRYNNQQVEEHIISISQIQNYQTFLFDQLRSKDINLRYKQRLQFWMLNEEEQLKYIKFNLPQPELVFKALTTFTQYKNVSVKIYPQLIQQLSTFKHKNFIQYLGIIKDKRFPLLLKQVLQCFSKLDDETFVSTVFAISRVHPKSQAIVYKKLSIKLYEQVINQIQLRVEYLSILNLSLLVRNLHAYPFCQNDLLQEQIASVINTKCQDLSYFQIYEVESFLKFLTNCSPSIMNLQGQTIMNLIQKLTTYGNSNQKQIQQFDIITLGIFSNAIVQMRIQNQQLNFNQLVRDVDLDQLIQKCELKDLVLFSTMLAMIDFPRNESVVKLIKKKLLEMISWKNQNIFDEEISQMVASLTRLDTQQIFKGQELYEKIVLQSCFQYQVFSPASPQYIPYTKMLRVIESDLNKFSCKSKLMILKCLAMIKHPNRSVVNNIVNSMIGYDPNQPNLSDEFEQDLETTATILQVYSQYSFTDQKVSKLLKYGMVLISQRVEKEVIKFETSLQLLQTIFFFKIKFDQSNIDMISKALITNLKQFSNKISTTLRIFALYFLLTIVNKSKSKQPSFLVKQTLNEIINSIQASQCINYEQLYILTLCKLLGCNMELDRIDKLPLLASNEMRNFIDHIQKIEDSNLQQIGTERFTKMETLKNISHELKEMGYQVVTHRYLEHRSVIYDRADLTINETQHIKLISLSQMVDNYGLYQLRGHDEVLKLMTHNLKFIVIEEYNRVSEGMSENPSACKEFLDLYVKN